MRIRSLIACGVALGLSTPMLGAATGCTRREEPRSDAAISQDLTQRLRGEAALATSSVQATSVDGRVTLRGFVRTDDARERAEDIAQDVPGVKDVSNQLEVAPGARTEPPAVAAPPPAEGAERPPLETN